MQICFNEPYFVFGPIAELNYTVMGKRSPVLLRHLDGDLGAAGEVPRRRVRDGVAGRLAEHLSVLAVTPLLAPRQVHGDRVEVREPANLSGVNVLRKNRNKEVVM